MYYKRSRSSVRGQGHSVKTSFDRQIIAFFYEIGVAEFSGAVRISIRSSELELAVSAHARYRFGKKQPKTTGAISRSLQVAMQSQLPHFLVLIIITTKILNNQKTN